MQFKLAAFTTVAVATLAAATGQCITGTLLCCNSLFDASSLPVPVTTLLGLLGIVETAITGLVGVTCSPISVIGIGGISCSAQPACCTNNSFNGIVALGCTPVNLNA